MTSILSAVLLGVFMAAVFVAVWAMQPRDARRRVEARLGLQGVEARHSSPVAEGMRPLLRLLVPLVRGIGQAGYRERIEHRFVTAGMTGAMTGDEFLACKVVMAVFSWILIVGIGGGVVLHGPVPLAVHLLVPGIGAFLPDLWLEAEVRRRQDGIRRALPYVMDLLTLSVEAGLDFVAGLHKVCEKAHPGPLVEELSFFLKEMQVGASRQQALRSLARRCAMPEISSFSALLVQADHLGASIGPVLRAQADLIRTQRHQRAERAGAYASQKILFPLIFCIMPAVFVIVFGPIALNFLYGKGVLGG
ncbi:MAG: type II secretion system F family protein [Deltaproteobacteria bacterium]|nr:type II secretion system F family protein [Deltaproteobacteria bacterium]